MINLSKDEQMFTIYREGEIIMEIGYGLVLIGEVIVMALLLVGFYHEDRFVAFENKICRAVRARHIRRKRAKAKKYLEEKGPAKADRAKAYLVKTSSRRPSVDGKKQDRIEKAAAPREKWVSERDYLYIPATTVRTADEKKTSRNKQTFSPDLLDSRSMRLIFGGGYSDPDAA